MATTKERQAAFRAKQREAGKTQTTLWLDPEQAEAVKRILAGEQAVAPAAPEPPPPPAPAPRVLAGLALRALCRIAEDYGVQSAVDMSGLTRLEVTQAFASEEGRQASRALMSARQAQHDREDDLARREAAVLKKEQKKAKEAGADRFDSGARIQALITAFTTRTDFRTGERVAIEHAYNATAAMEDMRKLSSKTTRARNSIVALVREYSSLKVLLEPEIDALNVAAQVLTGISSAATRANAHVKTSSEAILRAGTLRQQAASGAVEKTFADLSAPDAVLMQIHITQSIPGTAGNWLKVLPGETRATRSALYVGKDDATGDITGAVEKTMRAANAVDRKAADQAAAAIQTAFAGARAGLLEQHAKLVAHINACVVAYRFEEAAARGKP